MSDESEPGAWLRPEDIDCPHCRAPLLRLVRSPLLDEWLIYCDCCARRAEISYYDPIVESMSAENTPEQLFSAIEARLRVCSCGGRFSFSASRRCPACLQIVIHGPSEYDLWAGHGIPPDRDPTPEEVRAMEEFEAEFIRRSALWRPEG